LGVAIKISFSDGEVGGDTFHFPPPPGGGIQTGKTRFQSGIAKIGRHALHSMFKFLAALRCKIEPKPVSDARNKLIEEYE
jgi:hypothetical protein